MKAPTLTIDRKNKTVTVTMTLETAHPSKSTGQTMLIASTRGLRTSDEQFARRPVCFVANAFYYPPKPVNPDKDSEGSASANSNSWRSTAKARDLRK